MSGFTHHGEIKDSRGVVTTPHELVKVCISGYSKPEILVITRFYELLLRLLRRRMNVGF